MIKINLLGEEVKDHVSGLWWLVGYGVSAFALLLTFSLMYTSLSSSIQEQKSEIARLEQTLESVRKTTKEVRELEAKRKELRDKLAVIATLKRSKTGPVRVMDDLNLSLPDRSWLKSIAEKDKTMSIEGLALDNQTISTFMKALGGSEYFNDVELISSKQAEWQGSKIKQFELHTKVNYAGRITVPTPAAEASPVAR